LQELNWNKQLKAEVCAKYVIFKYLFKYIYNQNKKETPFVLMSVITIVLSTLFWAYIDTIKIFKNDQIVNSSLIHSFFATIYSNYACIMYPQIIYDYPSIENNIPSWIITSLFISYGYGFRDMYFGIKNQKMDEIAHATIFLISCSGAYYKNIIPVLIVPFTLESSSFFLNLLPLNILIVDILFAVTFALYRFGLVPTFSYYYCTNNKNTGIPIICLAIITMTTLNIYWFYLICRKAVRRYNRYKS
jgi:hypothetical protein